MPPNNGWTAVTDIWATVVDYVTELVSDGGSVASDKVTATYNTLDFLVDSSSREAFRSLADIDWRITDGLEYYPDEFYTVIGEAEHTISDPMEYYPDEFYDFIGNAGDTVSQGVDDKEPVTYITPPDFPELPDVPTPPPPPGVPEPPPEIKGTLLEPLYSILVGIADNIGDRINGFIADALDIKLRGK